METKISERPMTLSFRKPERRKGRTLEKECRGKMKIEQRKSSVFSLRSRGKLRN